MNGRLAAILVTLLAAATVADPGAPRETLTLDELLELSDDDLALVDIATMNLAAAEGLPGSEDIDIAALDAQLDAWARYVGYETARHMYRFEQHPEEYHHSFGEFAMLLMTSTLQFQLGVKYNDWQRENFERFDFRRSQDLFIHGLLQGTGGTCSSMPVLYVAIGRRLGYPLKLAKSADHFYLRWDDPETGEHFNIEGTSRGYLAPGDDYYAEWPRALSASEEASGGFMRPLSPREELSSFVTTRGDCLFFHGYLADAHRMYKTAVELWPQNSSASHWLAWTERALRRDDTARRAEAAYQEIQRRQRARRRIVLPGMPVVRVPTAMPGSARVPVRSDFVLPNQTAFSESFGPAPRPGALGAASMGPRIPMPPSSRALFEQMKRRTGLRTPDGRLPAEVPSYGHSRVTPPGSYYEVPMAPLPLWGQNGEQQ